MKQRRQSNRLQNLPPEINNCDSKSTGDGGVASIFSVTNAEINHVDSQEVDGHYQTPSSGNSNTEDEHFIQKLQAELDEVVNDGIAGCDGL